MFGLNQLGWGMIAAVGAIGFLISGTLAGAVTYSLVTFVILIVLIILL